MNTTPEVNTDSLQQELLETYVALGILDTPAVDLESFYGGEREVALIEYDRGFYKASALEDSAPSVIASAVEPHEIINAVGYYALLAVSLDSYNPDFMHVGDICMEY